MLSGPRRGSGAVVCDEGQSAPGRARAAVVPACLLLLLPGFRVLNYIYRSRVRIWSLAGIICIGNIDECHSLLGSSCWGSPCKGMWYKKALPKPKPKGGECQSPWGRGQLQNRSRLVKLNLLGGYVMISLNRGMFRHEYKYF